MCGIVGILSDRSDLTDRQLVFMRDTLIHRGPDDEGLWIDGEGMFVGLAHRRLSIIDLSPLGRQPMISSDGRIVITFNGEIYNYKVIRNELIEKGYIFKTNTDTEVIINSYIEWGDACVEKLRGMFAFGLWDKKKEELLLARDRIGEKPLYYYHNGRDFVFASELKAIVSYPYFEKKTEESAVIDFMSFGYIPDPKSIWKNCWKLEPGHVLKYSPRSNSSKKIKYWDIDFTPNRSVSESEWIEKTKLSLQESVSSLMLSDVPVGAFLSGGVDSGSVVAQMSKIHSGVKTISIGLNNDSTNELPFARNVVEKWKTDHYEKILSPHDIQDVFEKMLWHFDEPFNDFSYFPTYYVSKEARKIVKVALSGDGGDELLAGYPKYQRLLYMDSLAKYVPRNIRSAAIGAMNLFSSQIQNNRNIQRLRSNVSEVLVDSMAMVNSTDQIRRIINPDLLRNVSQYDPLDVARKHLDSPVVKSWDLVSKARYLDIKMLLSGDMLVKVDRASMANSLEVRPPLLDHRFVDIVSKIPSQLLVSRKYKGKAILKKAMLDDVPHENLFKKKTGFGFPLADWLRSDLKPMLDTLGKSEFLFYDKKYFTILLDKHLNNKVNAQYQLHSILFLELWKDKWLR